jgi:hypothetical protein
MMASKYTIIFSDVTLILAAKIKNYKKLQSQVKGIIFLYIEFLGSWHIYQTQIIIIIIIQFNIGILENTDTSWQ